MCHKPGQEVVAFDSDDFEPDEAIINKAHVANNKRVGDPCVIMVQLTAIAAVVLNILELFVPSQTNFLSL
jgi:hypothetical protein